MACSLVNSPQTSAVKPGASCKKVGQTKIQTGTQFTCIKKGKKLLWRKIEDTKKASPAPSIAPSPVPSPTASSNSTVTETIEYVSAAKATVGKACNSLEKYAATLEGPVICDKTWNLIDYKNDTIPSRAFRYVLQEYLAQPEGKLSIIWRIDPKTPSWKDQIEQGMVAGARLWGTSPEGSIPRYSYISPDPDWLYEKFKEDGLMKDDSSRRVVMNSICGAGMVWSDTPQRSPFWFYKFSADTCLTNVGFFQVPAHEYTHYAQYVLHFENRFSDKLGRIPWFDEGVASFIGAALGPMSGMPNNQQSMWAQGLVNVQRELKFFSQAIDAVYQDSRWGDVYPIGAIATEAMTAVIGFKKLKQIFIEAGTLNSSYEDAIKKVTGIGSVAWADLLQSYVDSVKSSNSWTLDYLIKEYEKRKA